MQGKPFRKGRAGNLEEDPASKERLNEEPRRGSGLEGERSTNAPQGFVLMLKVVDCQDATVVQQIACRDLLFPLDMCMGFAIRLCDVCCA